MFAFLDKLACWWIDWRQDQNVKTMLKEEPEMAAEIHKLSADEKGFETVMKSQAVFLLADQAAELLNTYNAKNYVEFDMMPRIDRGVRWIRVTVQWRDGESPAQKATRLEKELEKLKTQLSQSSSPTQAAA